MAEQALIAKYNPKYNTKKTVLFNLNPIMESTTTNGQDKKAKTVQANDRLGNTYLYDSINNAAYKLNISNRSISRSSNCIIPKYVYSPILKKEVHIIIKSEPMRAKLDIKYILPEIMGIDLIQIPLNKIAVYYADKKTLFGLFDQTVLASAALGLPSVYQPHKFVNKEHTVYSPLYDQNFYLVKNTLTTRNIRCKVTNVVTGETKIFGSISDTARFFNVNVRYGSKLKKLYIQTGKLYKNIYKLEFVDNNKK